MKWNYIVGLMMCAFLVTGCQEREEIFLQEETTQEESGSLVTTEQTEERPDMVYVYVCGHVKKPGVYSLENGARICDALDKAGGPLEDAKDEALDQAVTVSDGQTIYVPGAEDDMEREGIEAGSEDGRVNLNQATVDELMTLPGIGESKASVIVQYREEHGEFQTIEELMNIPGIKQGVFDKVKEHIKV